MDSGEDLKNLLTDDEICVLEEYRTLSSVSGLQFALTIGPGLTTIGLICFGYFVWGREVVPIGWLSTHLHPAVVAMVVCLLVFGTAVLVVRWLLRGHLARRRQMLDELRAKPAFQAVARKVYSRTRDPEAIDDESGYVCLVLRDRHISHLFT